MPKIDFKVTTWERIEIDDENVLKQVMEKLKSGEFKTANDVAEFKPFDESFHCSYSGVIDELETQMTVEENGGEATIVVLNDSGDEVWNNVGVK